MARLDSLPSIETIKGFKGLIDYYTWKGIPVVRKWPKKDTAPFQPDELTAALEFGAISAIYKLNCARAMKEYDQNVISTQQRTLDFYIACMLGHHILNPNEAIQP